MPNRIVIAGKIDPLSAAQFMEAPDFQDVFINSPGGDVMSGLGLYDFLRNSDRDVTVCGSAMSIAAIVVQAGKRRFMSPHSVMMFHGLKPSEEASNLSTERLYCILIAIVAERSKLPQPKVMGLFASGTYLTAQECLALNLIDGVIE